MITGNVDYIREKEKKYLLNTDLPYQDFNLKVHTAKWSLLSLLIDQKRRGRRIAAYGAAAKGNTLLNFCGIRTDMIDYVVDQSPFKQGKYLPGTHIPVRAPEYIDKDQPDFLLILPWNIQAEIMEVMSSIREWGAKFIVPIPSARIMD